MLKDSEIIGSLVVGCHLKPGKSVSDFTLGLYPSPPNLAAIPRADADEKSQDQRSFWIIKHGVKASGMPAWGPRHDDARIWSMVAFLKRLPYLTPGQYQIITARGTNSAEHH
ncbi:MAG: c-type cytochrome [Pseudomonadales bacterium]